MPASTALELDVAKAVERGTTSRVVSPTGGAFVYVSRRPKQTYAAVAAGSPEASKAINTTNTKAKHVDVKVFDDDAFACESAEA